MAIGYLLGGLACLIYMFGVGYAGLKKSPTIIKLVKLKLSKNMSDETAAKVCIVMAIIIGAVGIFLLVYGGIQG